MLLTPVGGATATTSGSKTDPDGVIQRHQRDRQTVQVEITGGTATVQMYARINPALGFLAVGDPFTASGAIETAFFNEWMYEIETIDGATVQIAVSGENR